MRNCSELQVLLDLSALSQTNLLWSSGCRPRIRRIAPLDPGNHANESNFLRSFLQDAGFCLVLTQHLCVPHTSLCRAQRALANNNTMRLFCVPNTDLETMGHSTAFCILCIRVETSDELLPPFVAASLGLLRCFRGFFSAFFGIVFILLSIGTSWLVLGLCMSCAFLLLVLKDLSCTHAIEVSSQLTTRLKWPITVQPLRRSYT